MSLMDRYHRQTLLPQIGAAGAAKLAAARVLLVGCGALGTTIAEQLVRAGVGFLRIVDRDVVELTNLQRQVLFDEADVAEGVPKAIAAGRRLARVNSAVCIEPFVADVNAENIEELARLTPSPGTPGEGGGGGSVCRLKFEISDLKFHEKPPPQPSPGVPVEGENASRRFVDLILDGTDNAETRYLLNDAAVKHNIPWIYGACIGTEGRVLTIIPGKTPCLRCLFPSPPAPGELPTCDTAGVLGPAAAIIGALQAAQAIRVLVDPTHAQHARLLHLDIWRQRFGSAPVADARRGDCPCCGRREFDFLDARGSEAGGSTSLCGRNAVQVRPPANATRLDLKHLETRLKATGADVQRTPHLLKCRPAGEAEISLTVFPDGRAIVHGTAEPSRARTLYARWVGA